ncbi:MAG: zf-HC2 domain-containing protein [Candidatus Velthaea sp.]
MTPEMDCIDLVEITTDYLEGKLAPEDAARLEAHLTECDGCTEYLRQMRITQDTLGRPDAAVIPAPGREKLLAAFRAWKAEKP